MPLRDGSRPNPAELLRRVQAAERRDSRGRLKIFLGYAPRVGKSLRMFDEGRRRKLRGQDVVVGALQNPVAPEIQVCLSNLEIIRSDAQGAIDLLALFRRHPQVCLIDGLALTNQKGSRNPQRWQDVSELLDRGIAVITALNVQHIREQQDAVERITGKRAAHSIPQAFLQEADEIEVVDAPPDALLGGETAPNMPDARRLSELRELALLLAADVVDHQLQDYLNEHGIAARWGAQERILVCLTPRSSAAQMLRAGHRTAARFHGTLIAVYVEQPNLRPNDRARLDAHLALARELGADVHSLRGADFVEAIIEFAREHRISQLFIGHSMRDNPMRLASSPIDRLLDAAEEFDVRIFPHTEVEGE